MICPSNLHIIICYSIVYTIGSPAGGFPKPSTSMLLPSSRIWVQLRPEGEGRQDFTLAWSILTTGMTILRDFRFEATLQDSTSDSGPFTGCALQGKFESRALIS